MKFFFDESGQFALARPQTRHCAAVVMGVVISELIEKDLESDFRTFVNGLSESEKKQGEPKGNQLTLRSRSDFCDLLDHYSTKGFMLTPVTMDMTSITQKEGYFTPQKMQACIENFSATCRTEEIAESYRHFAREFGTLSTPQAWKIFAWANGFREAIQHAVLFLCSNGHERCWKDVRFEVDRVSSLDETVFVKIVLGWLAGWSRQHRFTTVKQIHTDDNPFVMQYVRRDGLDLGKLVGNRIHFADSAESWGIQIADIASNIVFRAAHDLENTRGDLFIYASLMRSSPYGKRKGPGLINPTSEEAPDRDLLMKYDPMFNILKRRGPLHL